MITNKINPNPNPNSNRTLNRVFFHGPTSKKPNPPLNPRPSSLHFSPNPSSCKSLISAMALHLCRPKHRFPNNPSLIQLFSTSPDDNDGKNATQTNPTTPSPTNKTSLNSYFSDVKASLKTQNTTSPLSSSIEEIRKNLAEYRRQSAPPSPPPTGESNSAASQSQPFSFQELHIRNQKLNQNSEVKPRSGILSLDAIKESIRQMKANSNNNMNDRRSNMNAGNKMGQDGIGGSGSRVIGGTQELPVSVFGREMKEGEKGGEREREGMKTEFVKMYSYMELGEKLRLLRPEGGKSGEGFSLHELNERLMRLRELEQNDGGWRISRFRLTELRDSLLKLKLSREEKQTKS